MTTQEKLAFNIQFGKNKTEHCLKKYKTDYYHSMVGAAKKIIRYTMKKSGTCVFCASNDVKDEIVMAPNLFPDPKESIEFLIVGASAIYWEDLNKNGFHAPCVNDNKPQN